MCAQITADITCCQTPRPQARNHQMRMVLTNTGAPFEHLQERCRNMRGTWHVLDFPVDLGHECIGSGKDGLPSYKTIRAKGLEHLLDPHVRRLVTVSRS